MSEGKLYSKLAEIVQEVGYVKKDGFNDFHKYNYTSAEALLAALREPLSKRGVVLMPSLTAVSEREYKTSRGHASIITTAHVRFTLVDGESGEKHECDWAGQGDDPADKGLGKAYTNAIKTFLREQFLIPQGDDPEADRKTDERSSERKQSNGQARVVTAQDVASLTAAAKGLKAAQIKLAFSAVGLDAPVVDEKVFTRVPQAKAAPLAQALAGIERES